MGLRIIEEAQSPAAAKPRVRIIEQAQPRGPKPTRKAQPASMSDDLLGALTTLNRSLPGADELADAITAGAGTIRDLVAGDSPAGRDVGALLKGNWEGARRQSRRRLVLLPGGRQAHGPARARQDHHHLLRPE